MENDTEDGGEGLSMEQAVAAYAKASPNGADKGQPDVEEQEQGIEADEQQASDEDADDGNPDEEGQADDENDEEQDSDQGRFVASNGKVRLPDGTVSTIADLVQGNLRDRDYRQKTMELAQQRRAHEEQSSAFKASEQQVNEQREYMSKLLEAITPQPPDPKLLETDPIGFMQAQHQHQQFAQHLEYLKHQMAETRKGDEAKAQKERADKANAEMEALRSARPDLRDETKLRAFAEDIKSAASAAGFSIQEIQEAVPYDHRLALVLSKAAKWDRLQANKPKVVQQGQNRPPVQKSGKRSSPAEAKMARANDALNRLKQSGSVEDAAAAYLARKG